MKMSEDDRRCGLNWLLTMRCHDLGAHLLINGGDINLIRKITTKLKRTPIAGRISHKIALIIFVSILQFFLLTHMCFAEHSDSHMSSKIKLSDIQVYQMYTVAGNGIQGDAIDGAVATSSSINNPYGLFVDSLATSMYVGDHDNRKLRKVNLVTGITNVYAGDGISGNSGDGGPASSARFNKVGGVVGATSGVIYVVDDINNRIRSINTNGIINKYAGVGTASLSPTDINGDGGQATSATLNNPYFMVVSVNGIYLVDCFNHKIRKIDTTGGIISTIAGTGIIGSTGDGGYATSASLSTPYDVFVSFDGKLFISEGNGNRIRVINTSNIISLFAGRSDGSVTLANNVPATSTGIYTAYGVWGDTIGNIFYTAYGMNHNVLRIVSGLSGIVTTIAGNSALSVSVYATNGPALSIPLLSSGCVRGTSQGTLFVNDFNAAFGGSSIRGVYANTQQPTVSPTVVPSVSPSQPPSQSPTVLPSMQPTISPSRIPTSSPTMTPTTVPTTVPTQQPSLSPSVVPSVPPTISPSRMPTNMPSITPTFSPTITPTTVPTVPPTMQPTISSAPTYTPSSAPTIPVYQMFTVAGNGVQGDAVDGAVATSSSVHSPFGVYVDTTDSLLYFADLDNKKVRKINLVTGILNNFAGNGDTGTAGDGGQATSAALMFPVGVAGTTSGVIYISNLTGNKIQAVGTNGIINTVVGTGSYSLPTDMNGDGGAASSATINNPYLMATDLNNNLYFVDKDNRKVRKVDAVSGIISTIAGAGDVGSTGDGGYATSATLNTPFDVFVSTDGKVYISEGNSNRIRVINAQNIISLFAGILTGTTYVNNVPASSTGISQPCGIWGDTFGNLYYADVGNRYLRVVSSFSGLVTSVASSGAGSASSFVLNGPALSIPLLDMRGVAGDSQGRIFVTDISASTGGSSVRGIYGSTQSPTVSPTTAVPSQLPTISSAPSCQPSIKPTVPVFQMYTVAGNGARGRATDGAVATSSSLDFPHGIFVDISITLMYVADYFNKRIRKISMVTGITNVFAGDGTEANTGNGGAATSARFSAPAGIAGSTSGVFYISDPGIATIRVISPTGIINKLVGSGASTTPTAANGDGGAVTSATVSNPYFLFVDSNSNLYVADSGNNKIRKVDINASKISTIAGTGAASSLGDSGYATAASLNNPRCVFIDITGNTYITEHSGNRIRVIAPNNIITLFAGLASGDTTLFENVRATSSGISELYGVWVDTIGNVYFIAKGDGRVRVVSSFSGTVNSMAGMGGSTSSYVPAGAALSIPLPNMRAIWGDSQGKVYAGELDSSVVRAIYANTQAPTPSPSAAPSALPTVSPTNAPTTASSLSPTLSPTQIPTTVPSNTPTFMPTHTPSQAPSMEPSQSPTTLPTVVPSIAPSISSAPSFLPSSAPTVPVYQMYTVAGNGGSGTAADGAVATSSSLDYPHGIFIDSSATLLYVADMNNRKVRKINMISGITNVFAGSGSGNTGNGGAATSASFSLPIGVVGTTSGSIFISDNGIATIRVVTPDGIIQSIVDKGASSSPTAVNGDGGAASSATVKGPYFLCLDSSSNLFIADSGNHKIRKIDFANNIISTIAGTGATSSLGDGGSATSATVKDPSSVYIDISGNTYIAENGGNRIRVITTDNIITLFAGVLSGSTMLENVPATSSSVTAPFGIWVDTIGNVYFCVDTDKLVRVVSKFSGIVSSIAGTGSSSPSFISAGPALSIPLPGLRAVWGDAIGKMYVSQRSSGSNLVRAIYASTQTPTTSPSISLQPSVAPTLVPTASPSKTPTVTPTIIPSAVPTNQPTTLPSSSPTITPTTQPTTFPTFSPSSAPTNMPTESPSATPTTVPSNTPTISPTVLPSVLPTDQPYALPSVTPTIIPTNVPTESPSISPTTTPSFLPSLTPTTVPSGAPSLTPTVLPSLFPTDQPTTIPSVTPTIIPSMLPSKIPSECPSIAPTYNPTEQPSEEPSTVPTVAPSTNPTLSPSNVPSIEPSNTPSFDPTLEPSRSPTNTPTEVPISTTEPSHEPSLQPSETPTNQPSVTPSIPPSLLPTETPSVTPSDTPSVEPTYLPSTEPSHLPSQIPSPTPSVDPTPTPIADPTGTPTTENTQLPSIVPSTQPTDLPSVEPTQLPSISPTIIPTQLPSTEPSNSPSFSPTETPSETPTTSPTTLPTLTHTTTPSFNPSFSPSVHPSVQPTSTIPSKQPSCMPSMVPTQSPSKTPQTVKPTAQINTFPTETGLSVILPQDSQNRNLSVGAVIVLPFLRTTLASNAQSQQGYYDIDLSSNTATVGTNYVVYVNRSPNRPIDLNTLSPNEGFRRSPAVSYDYSGRSVSNAGDINGDGYDDLIIGVPYAARCYVLFGTAEGFVNMTEGFTIFGQADSMTGWSVSGARDVNNDTFGDIIIGAPYARDGSVSCGAAYVIFGSLYGHPNIHLQAELLSEQGFAIYGATQSELLGLSVSNAGDVNNDGFGDVIIGALKATSSYRGGAYVVYGTNASRDTLQLILLGTSDGFSMSGPIWSYSGYSVSDAGDVNGDGFDDVLIGSVPFRTTFGVQTTYLIYGNNKTTTATTSLSATLPKQQGVVISGGGVIVRGVGDINQDTYDDIMIGSNYGFSGGGFVALTYKDTLKAPTIQPTILPTTQLTLTPTAQQTKCPTTVPSTIPTREPTQRPSRLPTVLQSGPSQSPTEAPTGPTSLPSSLPSIRTKHPTSRPTTSVPSSRPSTQPTSKPSTQPSKATDKPTAQPTSQPITSVQPTSVAPITANPAFRSRNPVAISPTTQPTFGRGHNIVWINGGGVHEKQTDWKTNYIINTNESIVLQGIGFNGGNIYTVMPYVNGSLHIEIFNNISDKLNLTSHRTIHSMSDLIITSGSVIITFPTSGQRIRLANLTPLDISENNFMFAPVSYDSQSDQMAYRTVVITLSSTAVLILLLFIAYQLYKRSVIHKQRIKLYKEGLIALEDNPTRLIIAVNDMYAHFDAYIPNHLLTGQQDNFHNNNSSDSIAISAESKSNENSPLNSFETHNNHSATDKQCEQNSCGLYGSGDVFVSTSTISKYDSNNYNYHGNSSKLFDSYYLESGHHSQNNSSDNMSQTSLQSRQPNQQSDFNISMDSDLMNEIERNYDYDHDQPRHGMGNYNSDSEGNDQISMDSDLLSQV